MSLLYVQMVLEICLFLQMTSSALRIEHYNIGNNIRFFIDKAHIFFPMIILWWLQPYHALNHQVKQKDN